MSQFEKTKKEFEDLWKHLQSLLRGEKPGENDAMRAARVANAKTGEIYFAILLITDEKSRRA